MSKNVVLVTGATQFWGATVINHLLNLGDVQVIGVDNYTANNLPAEVDFIQLDLEDEALIELCRQKKVDTVCHLSFIHATQPSETAFEANVMRTVNLLDACHQSNVRKIVVKSNLAVYGAHPTNPAFLSEDHPLNRSQQHGYTRYQVALEGVYKEFRRQSPQTSLTILRFAHIVGPTVENPMTTWLSKPMPPTLIGFNPMVQLIHQKDAAAALVQAVLNDGPDIVNIAADPPLPLNKVLNLAGKMPLPILHPLAYSSLNLGESTSLNLQGFFPIEPDYLRYRLVADLNKMYNEMGFSPEYTPEEALQAFAEHLPLKSLSKEGYRRLTKALKFREALTAYRQSITNLVSHKQTDEENT